MIYFERAEFWHRTGSAGSSTRNRYFQILTGRNVREHLSHAVRPDNSKLIHYLGRYQTNVNRQVVMMKRAHHQKGIAPEGFAPGACLVK